MFAIVYKDRQGFEYMITENSHMMMFSDEEAANKRLLEIQNTIEGLLRSTVVHTEKILFGMFEMTTTKPNNMPFARRAELERILVNSMVKKMVYTRQYIDINEFTQ